MARKKSAFGLNNVFPVADSVTESALSSAFPDIEEATKAVVEDIGRTYANIPLERIVPNPFQPRKHFDQQKLQELADSLQAEGMLEPIIVRVSPNEPDRYEIAAGERRWRAARLAGWTSCPAEILETCSDGRMKRVALLENIQREQLTPLELAEIYDALLRERDDLGNAVYTVRSLAEALKKNKDHIDEHRALLRVPEDVRQLIEDDPDIPVRVVRELGNVEDTADRVYLIEEVRARNLKTADVLAILGQRKKLLQAASARSVLVPSSAIPASASPTQIAHDEASPTEEMARLREEADPSSVTKTVVEHERRVQKPSPALSLVVLERKLYKDQTQLEKVLARLAEEAASMSDEEKNLVRTYLDQWRERLLQMEKTL